VRLPAVLKAEPEQAASELFVPCARPAADLPDAVLDGDAHGCLEVRVWSWKRQRRVFLSEEQRDAVELDGVTSAREPGPVVPLDVA
jgi:hypothetical protein